MNSIPSDIAYLNHSQQHQAYFESIFLVRKLQLIRNNPFSKRPVCLSQTVTYIWYLNSPRQ